MSGCCNRQSPPQVIWAGDNPSSPWNTETQGSGRLYTKLLGAPTSLLASKTLLTDLAKRQEELFAQMLEQQSHVENHMSLMQSASRLLAGAQEDFFGQFHKFLAICHTMDMAKKKEEGMCGMAQSGSGQLVGLSSSRTPRQPIAESCPDSPNLIGQPHTQRSVPACASPQPVQCAESELQQSPEAEVPLKLIDSEGFPQELSTKESETIRNVGTVSALMLHKQRASMQAPEDARLISRLNYMLKCKEFEMAIAFAIFLNALVMCVECQYQGLDVGFSLQYPGRETEAHVVWEGAEAAFNILDWLFGILFSVEMLLKLACWRDKYFYHSRVVQSKRDQTSKCDCWQHVQGWNVLDFLTVVAFVIDKLQPWIGVNPQSIRLLRLFRLFRLIRLLRYFESLDHLYTMTTAISGLSKVLTWAVVLLTLMLLICNLCLVQTLQVTYFNEVTSGDLSQTSLKKHHEVYKYFGTCTRCFLSMFEITLGNWPPVARLLAEEVSEWFTLVCIVHKLTIGFAVIGVITGVILQETFKVAQTDDIIMLRQKKRASHVLAEKMRTLFETLDADPDGKLEGHEFISMLESDHDMKFWLQSLDIETDNLQVLFDLIDVDGSGYITVDELVKRIPRIRGAARCLDVFEMLRRHESSMNRKL